LAKKKSIQEEWKRQISRSNNFNKKGKHEASAIWEKMVRHEEESQVCTVPRKNCPEEVGAEE